MRTALEIAGLIALGASSRLIPHLPNMTAIGAIAFKSRARFGILGLSIPVVSLLLSDIVLGFYNWKLLVSVYASFALVGILGRFVKQGSTARIVGLATLSSLTFFFITNTVVWATSPWYPHTAFGLLSCLLAGLPFLYPMLAGDIVFSLALMRSKQTLSAYVFTRDTSSHVLLRG